MLSLLSFQPRILAQWQSIGTVDAVRAIAQGIELHAAPATVRITAVSPEIIRVRMSAAGRFLPDSSWAVSDPLPGYDQFDIHRSEHVTTLSTPALNVIVYHTPCRIEFTDRSGRRLNRDDSIRGMSWAGQEVAVWKEMPQDEYYFGFGEKSGSLQRRAHAMTMWNTDIPAYHADTDPLYEDIPFFYGMRPGAVYGIFFDNTYRSFFDMGKESDGAYSFGADGGELNYYFISGRSPEEIIGAYTRLTGRMPLPPRWSTGYQQCRWSYYPESRVRALAAAFRAKNIPCDVIYLDIHYMDGYRCFTWDKERFPDPKAMATDLAHDGFKLVTIIDPGIKQEPGYRVYDEGTAGHQFVAYPDGRPFAGKVWPGICVFPDFTRRETRVWWGSLFKGLVETGIRGFWNDMNEPSVFDVPSKTFDLDVVHDDMGLKTDHRKNHNIYGMQMARATHEGAVRLRPAERPFVLTRASYAGGQRYAAAWTGDNISTWEHLELAVPMCLNLSISGQPFVGTDIGGFVGSPSGELYARWLQLGIFTPLMRTHTEFSSADQEPWSYGPEFEAINRKSIELRYRLLPYLYTQFYRASKTGVPIMRPIAFEYPDDRDTYYQDREFLFGDAFLVAPVLWQGQTKRDVRLPAGEWYDYWTDSLFAGRSYARVDAPIDRIPLFVKAGAIITSRQVVQYSDQAPIDPLTVDCYPGDSSSTVLYEDDGISFEYRNGGYSLRRIEQHQSAKSREIVLGAPEGKFRPPARSVIVRFHGEAESPRSVTVDGKALSRGWGYDAVKEVVEVTFKDQFHEQKIKIIW